MSDILELHDPFSNPRCKHLKWITFTPRHFQIEGACFRNTMKIFFKGTGKIRNNFTKPGLKIASPNILAGDEAKTKNPQAGQVTPNIKNH